MNILLLIQCNAKWSWYYSLIIVSDHLCIDGFLHLGSWVALNDLVHDDIQLKHLQVHTHRARDSYH